MSAVGTTVARIVIFILGETALKQLVLELLKKFAAQTGTEVDDRLVNIIELALANKHDVTDLQDVLNDWQSKADETPQ